MKDTPIEQQQFLLSPRQESARPEQAPAPDFGVRIPTDEQFFAEYPDSGRKYEQPYDITPQPHPQTPSIQEVRTRYFGPEGDAGTQPPRTRGSDERQTVDQSGVGRQPATAAETQMVTREELFAAMERVQVRCEQRLVEKDEDFARDFARQRDEMEYYRRKAEHLEERQREGGLGDTDEHLRDGWSMRKGGVSVDEKLNEVQKLLGLSKLKNSAALLKSQEATDKHLEKALEGLVISSTSQIAAVMEAVDTILPVVCTQHLGKTYAGLVSVAFTHTATGSVAGHIELLESVEKAMKMIEVPLIDLQVIGKLQEADRDMAVAQRQAHHLLSQDTTLQALDVSVKRAFTMVLEPSLRKKVATTTSFIEMLARMYSLKNYGWDTRSCDAVMGLTEPFEYEVGPASSFAEVTEQFFEDLRRRSEPVEKTKLSVIGMGTLVALRYLPKSDDVVQSQMMVAMKVSAIGTTRQPDLTLAEVEAKIRKDLEKYLPVMNQQGKYSEAVHELSSKTYVATSKTEYAGSSSAKALAKKANFIPHLKKLLLSEGSPSAPEFVKSVMENRKPVMHERHEERGSREDPERWPRTGQLQERGGESRDEWPRRSDDARRGDRAGRGKSPNRNQERPRNVTRDNMCWAGKDCRWLYSGTCKWQHTEEEQDAAAAYNAGGARGRSPGRQRMEQIEPPRPDEHLEQQRPYGTYVAVVEPQPHQTYVSYMTAVVEQKGRKAPRIPVKHLHWSPKFSFEKFDRCKSPDTINQRFEKAFDEFDKRRQAERKYGIESGKKKQLQIRHPLNRPVQTSILSIKTHPIQPGGVPDSASVSVGPSTGARPQAMPVETPATVADGEWATKRAWLLEQAANQSPDEKQAFSTKHKGNALADIVEWMDELTDFK
jgi:hypothetical protein